MVLAFDSEPAQVCQNGHLVNGLTLSRRERNAKFCAYCGAPTACECEHCNHPIRGGWVGGRSGRAVWGPNLFKRPAFCTNCGEPFPWTLRQLEAAKELARDDESLTDDDRRQLEETIPEIVKDTPRTPVAAGRFKRLMKRAGKEVRDGLRKVVVDVASESAKKIILGP